MLTICSDFRKLNRYNRSIKFTLFHDRTEGNDSTIMTAFNSLINDPTYAGKDMFSTIAPLGWKDCILLQPADLVAFENFKQAEGRLEERESRKSYKALVDMHNFGIHSKTLNKESLLKLREIVDAARARTGGNPA